jgi:hypothetical protein
MEVQFEPAVQAKLEQIARESGRTAVDLVQDAVAGTCTSWPKHVRCWIPVGQRSI